MYNVINKNKLVLNLVLKQIIKNRNHTYLCVRNDTVNIENTRLVPIPISVSKIVRSERSQRTEAIPTAVYVTTQLI